MIEAIISAIVGRLGETALKFLFRLLEPLLQALLDRGFLAYYKSVGKKKVQILRRAKEDSNEADYNNVIDDI